MEELNHIREKLEQQRPMPWDAMPDIALYMDQIVSYLRRQTVGTDESAEPPMTPAMINNYIKDGLLPRANGKRYSREHLAYLTVIALLKNVMSVKDMKLLLQSEPVLGEEAVFYEKFLEKLDAALLQVASSFDGTLERNDLADFALDLAVASCAAKIACMQVLSLLRSPEK